MALRNDCVSLRFMSAVVLFSTPWLFDAAWEMTDHRQHKLALVNCLACANTYFEDRYQRFWPSLVRMTLMHGLFWLHTEKLSFLRRKTSLAWRSSLQRCWGNLWMPLPGGSRNTARERHVRIRLQTHEDDAQNEWWRVCSILSFASYIVKPHVQSTHDEVRSLSKKQCVHFGHPLLMFLFQAHPLWRGYASSQI